MAAISLVIAVLLVDLLLTPFNVLTGKDLRMDFDSTLGLPFLGVTIFAGLLAGSYPALYLSRFQPANVLKGKIQISIGEVWARKGLVVFQFSISIMLIVSVWVVYRQIEFVQSKNLGYKRDNVIYFDIEKLTESFLSEIKISQE
jgi:hypothetical protein